MNPDPLTPPIDPLAAPARPVQFTARGFPFVDAAAFQTEQGTPYLKESGVAIIGRPDVDLDAARGFLESFGPELGFAAYLDDPVELPPAERLAKFAGQVCYLSLGAERSWNRDADKYLTNIKASGHGSVLEHANFNFLLYGIDRSVTHEIVRHRAGAAFSQVSQRYVDGSRLRFVERPEFQWDLIAAGRGDMTLDANRTLFNEMFEAHAEFEADIDEAARRYERNATRLLRLRQQGHPMLQGGQKTEARKMVNQAARETLPNSTEAPIVVTTNARALRHVIEMRASGPADLQIRAAAVKMLRCVLAVSPLLFADYRIERLAASGTEAAANDYRKV